jgi:uncharacterized protein HemY
MDREPLETMLKVGRDNAMLRYTLGLLCFKQRDYQAAAEHLEQALRQDESHSASWKVYARTLAALERKKDAADAYEKGIAIAESKGDIQAAKEMKVFLRRLG